MALAPSPLSQVCKGVRNYLDAQINGAGRSKVNVVVAAPADTASAGAADSEHRLNLFFNRFEPSGIFPDTLPGETGWVRASCLVTPFAVDEDSIGAGENDLRLIGEVLRIFHEKPVLLLRVDGVDYQLQVIFQPLALEQLNQLWSTQGEAVYRPSLLYEVTLAPVLPAVKALAAPLAARFGVAAAPGLEERPTHPVEGRAPEVHRATPPIARADWAPAIALVYGAHCAYALAFELGSDELASFVAPVWIAGQPGESVALRWEVWDAQSGWRAAGDAHDALITSRSIDPDAAADAPTEAVALPPFAGKCELMLYAERTYRRAGDGAALVVRSNPLLISVYAP